MSASASAAAERSEGGLGRQVGWALTILAVGYAALAHHGLGPAPARRAPSWFDPSGFLLDAMAGGPFAPLGEDVRVGVAVFTAPAVALAIAVFLLTRAALPRLLSVVAAIAVPLFAFYGMQADLVWRFFHWRWSASMGLFAVVVGAAAVAPVLTVSWLRLSPWARTLSYLPIFAGLLLLERDVTGTDPALPFSVSPWPAVQVFGLDAGASALATLWLGGALGLLTLRLAYSRQGAARLPLVLLAAGLGAGLPPLWLWLGARAELLSFPVGRSTLGLAAAAGGAAFLAAASAVREPALGQRARVWGIAGILLALPLLLGQVLVRSDYGTTRDGRARLVIEALEAHYTREGLYPDRLAELVEAGDLDAVPRPRIGFGVHGGQEFAYQSFGTSFLLEFIASRWIQCVYNPPYEDEEDPADEAWSCPARPPELW